MARQRSRNTVTEMAVRRACHALGLRYRVHRHPLPGLRREADIVFGPAKVAVFVDGCFWHSCPEHGTSPRANAAWWSEKLRRNQERDAETTKLLGDSGWEVIRVWEHEDPDAAALRVAERVRERARRRGVD